MLSLHEKLKKAREISWSRFGKSIIFYLPGMFRYDGLSGKYPAVSITGSQCALQCDHCQGKILEPMDATPTPENLVETCINLQQKGNKGVLISGGCDEKGRLPWDIFLPAIEKIKQQTGLYVSVHSGIIDAETAIQLKAVGVDQALIDVIGDDETYQAIYHVPFGVSRIISSMEAMEKANLPFVPHIICGLFHGKINGEKNALQMISSFRVEQIVIVSLMRIRGTPAWDVVPPSPEAVVDIIADARMLMPNTQMNLGCARQRGNTELELLAVDAGINKMALPSDEAIQRAKDYGLTIRYQRTCCSVTQDFSAESW